MSASLASSRQDAIAAHAPPGWRFYAVITTGVYCRPGCASRLPKPENLRFFASAPEAEKSGFRPCLRCRPTQPAADTHADKIAAACRMIETDEETPSLTQLAKAAGMSTFHFHRLFKSATGVTPKAYATAQRAARLQTSLQKTGTVTEALYDAGFNASSRFYDAAPNLLGMTPQSWRNGGAGEEIGFATAPCPLGFLLAARGPAGISAIILGDDRDDLLRQLQTMFPKAEITEDDGKLQADLLQILSFLETPEAGLSLPLDIRGTAFQQRVWQALRQIPLGETASYAEIAGRIGAPKAARAVAAACAANRLALAIPCHRVVRKDGALSGYRWGTARKRDLLAREKSDNAG